MCGGLRGQRGRVCVAQTGEVTETAELCVHSVMGCFGFVTWLKVQEKMQTVI